MAKLKLYTSEVWLRSQLFTKGRSPEEIAKEAGCTTKTIYRYMEKFGIKKP